MVTTTSNGLAPYSDIAMRSAIEAHMKQRHWEVRDLAYAMGVSLGVTERWLAGDTAQTIFRAKLRRYLEGLGYPNTTPHATPEPEAKEATERVSRCEQCNEPLTVDRHGAYCVPCSDSGARALGFELSYLNGLLDQIYPEGLPAPPEGQPPIRPLSSFEVERMRAYVVELPVAIAASVATCRGCGCTDDDCSDCVERTGEPCHWVEPDLCSACATVAIAEPAGDGGLPPGFSILRPAMATTTIRPAGISISARYDRASLSKALVAALGFPSHVLVAADDAGCQLLIYAARGAGDGAAMRVNKAGDVSTSIARWVREHDIPAGFYEAKREPNGAGWRVVFIEF